MAPQEQPELYERPPIGVMPRFMAYEMGIPARERIADLEAGIERYQLANWPLPVSWLDERDELKRAESRKYWVGVGVIFVAFAGTCFAIRGVIYLLK